MYLQSTGYDYFIITDVDFIYGNKLEISQLIEVKIILWFDIHIFGSLSYWSPERIIV